MNPEQIARFIERNPILIDEARVLLGNEQGKEIGRGYRPESAIFYSSGSFQSKYMAREIHGGIKKTKDRKSETIQSYFRKTLANLLLLEELCPDVASLTPLFIAGIVDPKGEFQAMLMEDYSCNGQSRTYEMYNNLSNKGYRKIPESVKKVMKTVDHKGEEDLEDVAKAFVFVGNQRELRILDLDVLPWKEEYNERALSMK
ncbi:unnamed protein product, partial [marine sediment metagenome]